jgi:hypothetical protein
MTDQDIKAGLEFIHKHWLRTDKGYSVKENQLFRVTRVAAGTVYFRPVYRYQDGDAVRFEMGKAFSRNLKGFVEADVKTTDVQGYWE